MGGRITGLRALKSGRVAVYLDGRRAFRLTAVEAARLRPGQVLTDEEIRQLLDRDLLEQAHEIALRFLSYRPRSEREVADYLRRKGFDARTVEAELERLRRVGLVDDWAFARFWVENRTAFRPRSRRALQAELRRKGVPLAIIREVLQESPPDERALALRLARERAQRLRGLDPLTFRRRLAGYLARRGFDGELVMEILRTLEHEEDERLSAEG
ncbi:Regulatory protein RecX [Candidatus Thermoflexus japonica]|mgnify:CR=1 FL=1|uniref:Regulatory protein RecX n=1 Tax=Candidatus Thermoflexus japonica TaxID=2035417 RepID=A0A2H5Y777_9CHLR|nr:Regulatory protein RecX [Candidatus Thermoflexus japonica]